VSVYTGTSALLSVASGRISFLKGLTGPCLALDTACSSTLVTTHLARSGISHSECSRALSTGVGKLEQMAFTAFASAGMLSPHGRCHTFDIRADGYCRGESVATFLIGSTGLACASIAGTSVQQDGPSASLTAPNGSSQQ